MTIAHPSYSLTIGTTAILEEFMYYVFQMDGNYMKLLNVVFLLNDWAR